MFTPIITKTEFDKLSPEEKRVTIAKDVLARVKKSIIKPTQGLFLDWSVDNDDKPSLVNKENLNNFVCEACAKGALFASFIGLANDYEETICSNNMADNSEHQKLLELFSLEQLALIEAVFEGYFHIEVFDEEYEAKVESKIDYLRRELILKFDGTRDELIVKFICNNIIDNNGTFVFPLNKEKLKKMAKKYLN
jgi:hypothetical protein